MTINTRRSGEIYPVFHLADINVATGGEAVFGVVFFDGEDIGQVFIQFDARNVVRDINPQNAGRFLFKPAR